ncbi:MAG: DUF192 domain-containing protein [Patescibacteria group bacterium]|jgi:hypothetical protein
MKVKINSFWFGLIIVFATAGIGLGLYLRTQTDNLVTVTIGQTKITTEIAKTSTQKEQGLSGRTSLKFDSGMLFSYDNPTRPTFWMKGMKFPLDFIWVRDGKVIELTEHVAAPLSSMTESQMLKYVPKENVDAVIEVNGGFVEYNKIKVGDTVQMTN